MKRLFQNRCSKFRHELVIFAHRQLVTIKKKISILTSLPGDRTKEERTKGMRKVAGYKDAMYLRSDVKRK